MDDSRTPIVTAPVDLILSRVVLAANTPWALTTTDASNATFIPDRIDAGEYILNSFWLFKFNGHYQHSIPHWEHIFGHFG
jgi:hypothetical protein